MSELNYQSLNDCHESGLLNIWADADVIRYTNMRLPCTLEDIRKRIVIFRAAPHRKLRAENVAK